MRIAIVKSERIGKFGEFWTPLLDYIKEMGETVHQKKTEADTYIVLSGMFENPLCLRNGKRVLFYNTLEWPPNTKSIGWKWCERLLKHYYDEMVDCTDLTKEEIYKRIKCYTTAN